LQVDDAATPLTVHVGGGAGVANTDVVVLEEVVVVVVGAGVANTDVVALEGSVVVVVGAGVVVVVPGISVT